MHQTIHAVTQDTTRMQYNTAISHLMAFATTIQQAQTDQKKGVREACETLLSLMAPFAPHITEDLWHQMGHTHSIHQTPWPTYDRHLATEQTIEIAIQINGKKRDAITIPITTSQTDIIHKAQNSHRVIVSLKNKAIQKTIYVPKRLVNFVTV